jgi:hypothetical protein
MRPDIRFSDRPLEDIWCQAVAVLVFQRPSINMGALSSLDRKMIGDLSKLLEDERWTGDRGENFLFATQNMIKADKLLFHGLGPQSEFSTSLLKEEAGKLGNTLDKLGVNEFGVHVPVTEGLEAEYASHIEASARGLLRAYYRNHKDEQDFDLKIIFTMETRFMDMLDYIVERLRKYLRKMPDSSIIIDNKSRARVQETEEMESSG